VTIDGRFEQVCRRVALLLQQHFSRPA
jgi:hypothetical protein